ncbi:MAG: ROK family protein, partial [Candidatus Aenigmatarchaeota archaeon]
SAAVYGEYRFGAGIDLDNIVYVTISTGIGGGCIIDKHLLFGKDGNVAEVGHTTIDFSGELKCSCGGRGHWEAYCSGKNIPVFARVWAKNNIKNRKSPFYKLLQSDSVNTKDIFELARRGDAVAEKFIDEIGRLNSIGLANITNLYDPSLITIGGTVALKNPDLILNPINKYLGSMTFNRAPEVRITPLGENAVLYGALAAVFDRVGFPGE